MSLAIETIEIGGIEDGRFVLGNHQRAAVLDIGTDWDRIRIGCRMAMDDTGANITGTPRLYIGLLSNPAVSEGALTNGPLNGAATSHFVGVITSSASWSRNAGPPVSYARTGANSIKKVGATFSGSIPVSNLIWADPDNRRQPWFVEVEKGSPNWTIRWCRPANTNASEDVSLALLREVMEASALSGGPLPGGASWYPTTTADVAVDEGTDGPLNALCIAWDRTASLMRFSEVLFTTFPA